DRDLVKYRCHVGHGYTEQTMVTNQDAAVEAALWAAVRALEEKAALRLRMAERAVRGKLNGIAHDYARRAEDAHRQAAAIREVLGRSLENEDGGGGRSKSARHNGRNGRRAKKASSSASSRKS